MQHSIHHHQQPSRHHPSESSMETINTSTEIMQATQTPVISSPSTTTSSTIAASQAMHLSDQEAAKLEPSGATMTVLESLEPAHTQLQPVLSVLDPVQQQQVAPTVIHQLVQQQQPQPQPHLHQLQAPSRNLQHEMAATAGEMADDDGQRQHATTTKHLQHHHQNDNQPAGGGGGGVRANSMSGMRQQRPQIEGIVADGGGPIVQWLLENYEIADGESLPRSTVYNHYLAHCRQLQMSSVNAASFGKLIRSVFVGLKTRRLGTRGHSKYHYFGVRAKQHVRLDWIQDELGGGAGCSSRDNENSNQNTDNGSETDSASEQCGGRLSGGGGGHNSIKRTKRSHSASMQMRQIYSDQTHELEPQLHHLNSQHHHHQQHQHHEAIDHHHHLQHHNHHHQQQHENALYYSNGTSNGYTTGGGEGAHTAIEMQTAATVHNKSQAIDPNSALWPLDHCELSDFRNHLGANWATLVDDHWPQREPGVLERQLAKATGGCVATDGLIGLLEVFELNYKSYYKRMIELLSELKFIEVERLWFEFWHPNYIESATASTINSSPAEPPPPKHETTGGGGNEQWTSPTARGATDTVGMQPSGHGNELNSESQQEKQQLETTELDQQQQPVMDYHQPHHHQPIHHHHLQQQQQLQQQVITMVAPGGSQLTFNQLYELTSQLLVIERIDQIDYNLYAAIESFLLPDMLSPIPRLLAQQIRAFAKNIGSWIESAIRGYSPQFVGEKSKSARAFGYALRRYTSINHLSTASRAIWEKRSALVQMSIDLSSVDLRDIEHQVSLMSQAQGEALSQSQTHDSENTTPNNHNDNNLSHDSTGTPAVTEVGIMGDNNENSVAYQHEHHNHHHHHHHPNNLNLHLNNNHHHQELHHNHDDNNQQIQNNNNSASCRGHQYCALQPAQLIQNFLNLLEDPYPANSWPDWCRNLVESRVCGQSFEEARNFILKWNFYISLIMKELTLKSASSLSSFQLIRLLFDEYMYYLVVSKLAQAQHKTPAQLLRPPAGFEPI